MQAKMLILELCMKYRNLRKCNIVFLYLRKKTSLLKTIVQGFLTNEYILHAFYGQSDVVAFPFKNTYPSS